MRTLKLLGVFLTTTALILGAAVAVTAQDETDEGPSPYFFGEFEGFLHHDMDNPLGCEIGFTSDTTMTGESTLLGSTTAHILNCYVPADTLSNVHDSAITLTSENGDTLTGSGGWGDSIPDWVADPDGVWTTIFTADITGGTGAFEGATGELHGVNYVENVHVEGEAPGDAHGSMILEGLIEY